jgi:GNAT superfamily N-acetyltransferase
MDARNYHVTETLRDGTRIVIRALRPEDEEGLLQAVARMSRDSIVLRFFSVRRAFSEAEVAYFVDVDFVSHVALVATLDLGDGAYIVAGARYIVVEPGVAEVAFAVDDAQQGRGIGGLMMKHIVVLARAAGLVELRAEVLPENQPMLRVFRGSGLDLAARRKDGVVHLRMPLLPESTAAAPIAADVRETS